MKICSDYMSYIYFAFYKDEKFMNLVKLGGDNIALILYIYHEGESSVTFTKDCPSHVDGVLTSSLSLAYTIPVRNHVLTHVICPVFYSSTASVPFLLLVIYNFYLCLNIVLAKYDLLLCNRSKRP